MGKRAVELFWGPELESPNPHEAEHGSMSTISVSTVRCGEEEAETP